MKVLCISWTSVLQEHYRRKLHYLSRLPEIELTLLCAPYWKELWSFGSPVKFEGECEHDSFNTTKGRVLFAGNLHLSVFVSSLRGLLRQRPDVIDVENEPFNLGAFQVLFLARKLSPTSKIVFNVSQTMFKNYPPPFNWFEKYVARNAHGFFFRSPAAQELAKRRGYRGKSWVIGHGVDPAWFRPPEPEEKRRLREKWGLAQTTVVGFVGSLVRHKGVHLLIEAFAEAGCEEALLLLVGDGAARGELVALAKARGILGRVVFTGRAGSHDLAELYRTMDILVLPSLTTSRWEERFGRVILEGAATGLPVVGSSCGSIPYVISDPRLIFPEGDKNALRDLLSNLCEDAEARKRLGSELRHRVLERYSWEALARRIRDAYEELLTSG